MSSGEGDDEATRENNLLSFYEELFRDRFTERDAEFMRTLQQPRPPPPCVENWYTRPKRTFDYTARNQQDNRGFRGHNRQPYGGRFSHGQSYSNERQWGDGNRDKSSGGFYHCRRDQFLPKDNYDHVHYAGIRERVRRDDDGPPPKASRQTDAQQSH